MSGRTTDKYVKIKKLSETAPENEIRIRAIPQIGRYISYAASLILEKKMDTVLIKASGNAAKNACQIAEILRHRIAGLHQLNTLKTISVIDEYEPREEGLDKVVMERKLAVLEINLSLKAGIFDTKAPGYQAPLPADQVQEDELKNILEGRRRGPPGGRGGDRPERGERDERDDRDERGGRGGFRRGRYAGPRGSGRGGFRGGRRDYEDREERGDREDRGGSRGGYRGGRRDYEDREEGGRGGYRGGYRGGRRDYEDREEGGRGGYRGGYRGGRRDYEDREEGGRGGYRGGYRGGRRDYEDKEEGSRGGYRGGYRGAPRGGRGGDRGGDRRPPRDY